jgi:hypothetical protein
MSDTDRLYAGMAAAIADANEAQAAAEAGTSTFETYDDDEARRRAVRRASGAVGRNVKVEEVRWDESIDGILTLKAGGYIALKGERGNVAHVDGGQWFSNGRELTVEELDRLFSTR